ncbi:hypothetical protein JCM11251_002569 [Rhodosporidiobolus azoricus]
MAVPPQTIAKGSELPTLSFVERLDILYWPIAAKNGFIVVCGGSEPGLTRYTFDCGARTKEQRARNECCTFGVVVELDEAKDVYKVQRVSSKNHHSFKPTRADRRRAQKEADDMIKDAKRELRDNVEAKLIELGTVDDPFSGAGEEQAKIIRELVPILGEEEARTFEVSLQKMGYFAADYPVEGVLAHPAASSRFSRESSTPSFGESAPASSPGRTSSGQRTTASASTRSLSSLAEPVPLSFDSTTRRSADKPAARSWPSASAFESQLRRIGEKRGYPYSKAVLVGDNEVRWTCETRGCRWVVSLARSDDDRWRIDERLGNTEHAHGLEQADIGSANEADQGGLEPSVGCAGGSRTGKVVTDKIVLGKRRLPPLTENSPLPPSKKQKTPSNTLSDARAPVGNKVDDLEIISHKPASEPPIPPPRPSPASSEPRPSCTPSIVPKCDDLRDNSAKPDSELVDYLRSLDEYFGELFERELYPRLVHLGVPSLKQLRAFTKSKVMVEKLMRTLRKEDGEGALMLQMFEEALLVKVEEQNVKAEIA